MGETAKTIEVDGIEVAHDPDKLTDQRFLMLLCDVDDDSLDGGERLLAQSRMLRFAFGADRDRIMDELAERNGGKLDAEVLGAWWVAYLKAAKAKN